MSSRASRPLGLLIVALFTAALAGSYWYMHVVTLPPAEVSNKEPLVGELRDMVDTYRKVLVLMADIDNLSDREREQATLAAHALFTANHERRELIGNELWDVVASHAGNRSQRVEAVLDYIEQDGDLYDGDELVFREPLLDLQGALAEDHSLRARKLSRRVSRDIQTLDGIEQQYNSEIDQLFSRSENHTELPNRTHWNEYIAHLQALYPRAQLLQSLGGGEAAPSVPTPVPVAPVAHSAPPAAVTPPAPEKKTEAKPVEVAPGPESHIYGDKFPPKVIALTFDDGPHPRYTAQIVAILQHYHLPATFFEIGQNIGTINAQGQPVLGKNAAITRMLIADGYPVGNHTFTHPIMSKLHGAALLTEIDNTDRLLKAVDPNRPPIFRFPYGAHNPESMGILEQYKLQSILWNVDSLDWADPVPSSVADRVLRGVDKVGHGIILFHDIHDRAVKALPGIIDHLRADGYQFAVWDGHGFSVPAQ